MQLEKINTALSLGDIDQIGVFPHLDELSRSPYEFRIEFGLENLPGEQGVIMIRGARQYGKSTWLEHQLKETIKHFGAGSAYYLNGDLLADSDQLIEAIRELAILFRAGSKVKRLFIDEITAVTNWQRAIKVLADAGELQDILIVTTGSRANDLRRGSERLPGRKGKLDRTDYYFTPISFAEFARVCGAKLKENTLPAYILSGGSPVACSELAQHGRLPEYVVEMTRDWIYGEISRAGRSRAALISIMDCLYRYGGVPLGQAKLARESGMANNTVAAKYIELLMDLICVSTSFHWDHNKHCSVRRKPCKYYFCNLLVAICWNRNNLRSIGDFQALPANIHGLMLEWLVAQELWRRSAINGDTFPEFMNFWKSANHELDFVLANNVHIEVKRGQASPIEFSWFPKTFPNGRLIVINSQRFETEHITGLTFLDFLTTN